VLTSDSARTGTSYQRTHHGTRRIGGYLSVSEEEALAFVAVGMKATNDVTMKTADEAALVAVTKRQPKDATFT